MKEVVGRRRRTAMVVEQGRIALFRQRLPLRAIKLHFSSRQENLTLERKPQILAQFRRCDWIRRF